MVQIKQQDWSLLPHVPPGQDAVNVSPALERKLAELDYIDGIFDVVLFKSTGPSPETLKLLLRMP